MWFVFDSVENIVEKEKKILISSPSPISTIFQKASSLWLLKLDIVW